MNMPAWVETPDLHPPSPLRAGVVDLWLVELDQAPPGITDPLDAEERRRAGRFVFPRDARHFAAARGYLRHLLGAYLSRPAAQVAFELGPWGKPALKGTDTADLAFNIAHSGGRALIAIGRMDGLGVDLEQMRPVEDWRQIARGSFAPGEAQAILAMPPAAQMEAFFACWTRKEAVIKLWGEGLSADLRCFEVSVDPDMPARVLSVSRPGVAAETISLWGFKATSQSWAALALPATGEPVELRFRRLV